MKLIAHKKIDQNKVLPSNNLPTIFSKLSIGLVRQKMKIFGENEVHLDFLALRLDDLAGLVGVRQRLVAGDRETLKNAGEQFRIYSRRVYSGKTGMSYRRSFNQVD